MYDLSNMIFCPIGSALTKHPVASQIWTHNSNNDCEILYRHIMMIIIIEPSFQPSPCDKQEREKDRNKERE